MIEIEQKINYEYLSKYYSIKATDGYLFKRIWYTDQIMTEKVAEFWYKDEDCKILQSPYIDEEYKPAMIFYDGDEIVGKSWYKDNKPYQHNGNPSHVTYFDHRIVMAVWDDEDPNKFRVEYY